MPLDIFYKSKDLNNRLPVLLLPEFFTRWQYNGISCAMARMIVIGFVLCEWTVNYPERRGLELSQEDERLKTALLVPLRVTFISPH